VDDSAALSNLLDVLNETKDIFLTISKTRKKMFGYASARPFFEQLSWQRKRILECVNVLALSLVATDDRKDGRYDATRFLEDSTTKVFWIKHAGMSERKMSWEDFQEAFEYDFGVQDISFTEALRDEISTGPGFSRAVSVYKLAKFTRRTTLYAACLKLGNSLYRHQYNQEGLFDRMRNIIFQVLSSPDKNHELTIPLTSEPGAPDSSSEVSSSETSPKSVTMSETEQPKEAGPEGKTVLKGILGEVPSLDDLETSLDSLQSILMPLAISHHLDPKDKRKQSLSSVPKSPSFPVTSSTSSSSSGTESVGSDSSPGLGNSLAAAKARKKLLASQLVTNFKAVKEEVHRLSNENDKRLKILFFYRYLLFSEFLTGEVGFTEKMKTTIGKIVRDAIKKGAPSYNSGTYKLCYEIYKQAIQSILTPANSHECHDLCRREECLHELNPLLVELKTSLDATERAERDEDTAESSSGVVIKSDDWDTRAWILRRGFDFLLFNKLI